MANWVFPTHTDAFYNVLIPYHLNQQACPRGYRPDNFSTCVKCDDRLTFYDALYLGFMALLSLVLHWVFIDYQTRAKR